MPRYFNTALASSMLPDGPLQLRTLTPTEAGAWLRQAAFINAANPNHGNTLTLLTKTLAVELRASAQGGKLALQPGDVCLISEVRGLPRVTREFTDAEIAAAEVRLRLVAVG